METLKIVKIGGNIIDDQVALNVFLSKFSALQGPKVLVHGGGKLATQMANDLDIDVRMTNGRRITDADTLDIITMVYAGKINKNLVAQLQKNNCNAMGFTGADGNCMASEKRPIKDIDFGFVGDIKKVDTKILELLLSNLVTPVFCAITHDAEGQLLNTNADTIASELAIAFAKDHDVELYYCFEKNGVLFDLDDDDSVIENIDETTYKELKGTGVIAEGMIPKLDNCQHAIDNGVKKVFIGKPGMLFGESPKYTTIQQ